LGQLPLGDELVELRADGDDGALRLLGRGVEDARRVAARRSDLRDPLPHRPGPENRDGPRVFPLEAHVVLLYFAPRKGDTTPRSCGASSSSTTVRARAP